MRILTGCLVPLAFTWSLGVGVLQPIGRVDKYSRTMIIACVINVCLNAVLIPLTGTLGAAIATFLTETSIALLFYYYSKDFIRDAFREIKFIPLLFAALAAVSLARFTCNMITINAFILMVIGFFIFFSVYIVLIRLFHRELWQLCLNVLRSFFSIVSL